jgi:hypothetical protein
MLFFQYLPKLPLPDLAHFKDTSNWSLNFNKQTPDSLTESGIHYALWNLPAIIEQWIDSNIINSRDFTSQIDFRTFRATTSNSMLLCHTDHIRKWALTCLLDCGGMDVYTNFYIEPGYPLIREQGLKFIDNSNLEKIYSVKIQPLKWHLLNTEVIHSVTGLTNTRKSLTIGIDSIDPYQCIQGYSNICSL